MSPAEEPAVDPVMGTPLEDAVEVVLDREQAVDRGSVRSALDVVAADGTVSREGIDAALGEAAQYVATPENRLEQTEVALDAAREAAAPAADLDAVQSRLDALEARYRDLEGEVDGLRDCLEALVARGRRPEDAYDLARSIRDLRWDVRDVHGRAEQLRADLESFETWANDPATRFDELESDVEHVQGLLDGLATAVDDVAADGAGDAGDERDPAVAWADAALQQRVIGLLVADLEAELSDLRAWPERDGATATKADRATGRADEVAPRIDDLRSREREIEERLDTLARPAWRERFGGRIESFEGDLDPFDPPVRWGAVQAVLEESRSAVTEGD